MSKSLFKIQEQHLELMTSLMDSEGEITEELAQLLEINEKDLSSKAEGYVQVIKKFEAENKYIDDEIKRLQSMKKTRVNALNRLKTSISNAMNLFKVDKIETPLLKINFRKSETVEVNCDIEDLPPELVKIEKKIISKTEIKAKLKEGKVFAGIELKINQNLQIK